MFKKLKTKIRLKQIKSRVPKDTLVNLGLISVILILALVVRINWFEHASGDYENFLKHWYLYIKDNGFYAYKDEFSNYNPPYLYFLGLATLLPFKDIVAIKIISVFFDFVMAATIFGILRTKFKTGFIPVYGALVTLFVPTILLNSAYWGQCDSIYVAFLLLSLYTLLTKRSFWALTFFGIALSFKIQAVFFAPVLLVFFINGKIKWWDFLMIPYVFYFAYLPSLVAGRPLNDLLRIYIDQAGTYEWLTANLPTIYELFPDSVYKEFAENGVLIAASIILLTVLAIYNQKIKLNYANTIKITTLFAVLCPFILPKMHDRYFFFADAMFVLYIMVFPKKAFVGIIFWICSLLPYLAYLMSSNPFEFQYATLVILGVVVYLYYDVFKDTKSKI